MSVVVAPRITPRLGVVVPARNEESHLGTCLAGLDAAASAARLPLEIVLVLDSCTDGTARAAAECAARSSNRVHVVETDVGLVGTARKIGFRILLDILGRDDDWLATTDADSVVPVDWFTRQLAHRAAGAGVVVGTVQVGDWQHLARLRPHWERAYAAEPRQPADGHRHVHGANLSFAADSYRRTGGFAEVASNEDVRLVEAFRAAGESIIWASDLPVATSVRRVGRAPHGFAAYLNRLSHALDAVGLPESGLEPTA